MKHRDVWMHISGKIGASMFNGSLRNDPLLTTDEVAAFLSVDVVTVRRLIAKGELGAYRIASEYRIRLSDLEDYLQRQYMPAKQRGSQPDGTADPEEASQERREERCE
jgi:excisionase family DNA binding protein